MRITRILVVAMLIFLMAGEMAYAQMDLPRVSPYAEVSQVIGITTVKVTYHRPGVKERVIWGELVPYDEIWRTGANKATSISFDTDVMVAGKQIEKGSYSLFTIPGMKEWTVILNGNTELWGTNGYNEEQDALRFSVEPTAAPFTERMMFYFDDLKDDGASLVLQWENLKIQIPLKMEVHQLVTEEINENVNWQLPYRAAGYILENDLDLEKGQKLLDASLILEENYWNKTMQARFLMKKGYRKEAVKTMENALKMGKEMERSPFNLAEMEKMLQEWKK